jgi:hypothetical protein
MNTFKRDLEFSQYYELELLKHIEYDTYEQAPTDKAFNLWDIKVINKSMSTTYEIKTDKHALMDYSKCIAIEFYQRGHQSGINVSKCNIWAHFCIDSLGGYQLYLIPRKDLIKMINRQEYKTVKKTYDDSHFVLIELDKIQKYLYKTVDQW